MAKKSKSKKRPVGKAKLPSEECREKDKRGR